MRRWRSVAVCVLCAMYLETARASAIEQPTNSAATTLSDFKKRVDAYMTVRKAVEDKVGALDPTKSPKEIADRETALGEAIRAARPNAKQGSLLTPEVAAVFRRIIRTEFAHRSRLALKNREEAQDELPAFTPTVNQIYPSTYPLATFPPALLRELPELPKPMEYRLVRQSLILRDSEANLIVDVLPNAAPPMTALPGGGRK